MASERFKPGHRLFGDVSTRQDPAGAGPFALEAASPRDTGFILRLIDEAGWAYTREEVERLQAVQPEGMLVLRSPGLGKQLLGCVYASAWGDVGFIGLMHVSKSHRGRGLGRALMDRALDRLRRMDCRTVGLDAVGDAVGFYQKMGFGSHWESLRYSIDPNKVIPVAGGPGVRRATDGDIPVVAALDASVAGMDREELIWALQGSSDATVMVVDGDGGVEAYGVLRRSKGCMRLGPVIAREGRSASWVTDTSVAFASATAILRVALAQSRPSLVTVNVPANNREAMDLVLSLGGVSLAGCIRMYIGEPGPAYDPPGVWALGAAEKG